MPTALFVLVFVSVIPYVLAGLGGYAKVQQLGHLDNHHPRLQERKLSGRDKLYLYAFSCILI